MLVPHASAHRESYTLSLSPVSPKHSGKGTWRQSATPQGFFALLIANTDHRIQPSSLSPSQSGILGTWKALREESHKPDTDSDTLGVTLARDSAEDEWTPDCRTRRWWERVDHRGAWQEEINGDHLRASGLQTCLPGACRTGWQE